MSRYTAAVAKRPVRQVWGVNIQRLLDERGHTATAIAEKAGMGVQQLSNLIRNPNPQIQQLQRVANALGVPLGVLFSSPSSSRQPSPTEASHASSPPDVAPAATPEALRTAVRGALKDVLTDILAGLAEQAEPPDEPVAGARAPTAPHGDVSPERHRAVR